MQHLITEIIFQFFLVWLPLQNLMHPKFCLGLYLESPQEFRTSVGSQLAAPHSAPRSCWASSSCCFSDHGLDASAHCHTASVWLLQPFSASSFTFPTPRPAETSAPQNSPSRWPSSWHQITLLILPWLSWTLSVWQCLWGSSLILLLCSPPLPVCGWGAPSQLMDMVWWWEGKAPPHPAAFIDAEIVLWSSLLLWWKKFSSSTVLDSSSQLETGVCV